MRRRLGLSDVSHSRLRRFLRDTKRRPRVSLPTRAPTSLAVVVPCYSHAAHLPEMLEGILAQTRAPDEVIFVDDCSPDGTDEILRAFIAAHPRPAGGRMELLVNDHNIGQAASLNRAIAAASSELIMIQNDDDYLMHDAVEAMLGYFAEYRDVALIGCASVIFGGTEALAASAKLSEAYATPDLPLVPQTPEQVPGYRHPNDLNMTHTGSCFYKAAWEAVGGYYSDKRKRVVPFSDRDFQIRMNALFPVAVADTPYAFWRHDSSVDRELNS